VDILAHARRSCIAFARNVAINAANSSAAAVQVVEQLVLDGLLTLRVVEALVQVVEQLILG
jgi:hypothetical protein